MPGAFRGFLRKRFVEHEVRPAGQNVAHLGRIRHQGNAQGFRAQLLGAVKYVLRALGVIEIDNERCKFLFLDSCPRRFQVAAAVHGNAEWRQDSAQDFSRLIVGRNQ
jgi:hypothetical protein